LHSTSWLPPVSVVVNLNWALEPMIYVHLMNLAWVAATEACRYLGLWTRFKTLIDFPCPQNLLQFYIPFSLFSSDVQFSFWFGEIDSLQIALLLSDTFCKLFVGLGWWYHRVKQVRQSVGIRVQCHDRHSNCDLTVIRISDYRYESRTGPLSCFVSTNSQFVRRNHQK
jgi:hypothetical protein